MEQIIAITQVTMKRLLNYQRVVQNQAKGADQRQWIEMTLETMRCAQTAKQTAAHIDAIVAYAGYLFRIQNKMTAYRILFGDYRLHNALVALMHTLDVPVEMVAVEIPDEADVAVADPSPSDHLGHPHLQLVQPDAAGNAWCRR